MGVGDVLRVCGEEYSFCVKENSDSYFLYTST
jgi:hypothetical protein